MAITHLLHTVHLLRLNCMFPVELANFAGYGCKFSGQLLLLLPIMTPLESKTNEKFMKLKFKTEAPTTTQIRQLDNSQNKSDPIAK